MVTKKTQQIRTPGPPPPYLGLSLKLCQFFSASFTSTLLGFTSLLSGSRTTRTTNKMHTIPLDQFILRGPFAQKMLCQFQDCLILVWILLFCETKLVIIIECSLCLHSLVAVSDQSRFKDTRPSGYWILGSSGQDTLRAGTARIG